MLSYGSVCSGIEAASVAWEPLGFSPAWFAEIEKFPSQVLAHHWPEIENLGDMTAIAEKVYFNKVHAPAVLVGGTPCQAFSVAGLRKGLDDLRGQLTLSYVVLLNAIDEKRKSNGLGECVAVWENVPGVLSSKDNAFGCFLAGLAGESEPLQPAGKRWPNAGCVFGPQRAIAWRVLDAQYFGVAQRRRRVFLVASARNGFDPCAVLFESEGVRRDIAPSRSKAASVAALTANGVGTCGADDNQGQAGHLIAEAFGGNNTRGPIDIATARNACASGSGRLDFESETFIVHGTQDPCTSTELAFALGRNNGGENVVSYAIQAGALRTNPNSGPDGVGVQPDIAYTLEARAEVQAVSYGIPGNWIGRKPENGGNAVEPMIDISPCLTKTDQHAVAFAENSRGEIRLEGGDGSRTGALSTGGGKPGQGCPVVAQSMQVRRLTPRECERLQGFPDDHTLIPLPLKSRQTRIRYAADGPRYKALGNSMAVPCMAWIGKRLKKYLSEF